MCIERRKNNQRWRHTTGMKTHQRWRHTTEMKTHQRWRHTTEMKTPQRWRHTFRRHGRRDLHWKKAETIVVDRSWLPAGAKISLGFSLREDFRCLVLPWDISDISCFLMLKIDDCRRLEGEQGGCRMKNALSLAVDRVYTPWGVRVARNVLYDWYRPRGSLKVVKYQPKSLAAILRHSRWEIYYEKKVCETETPGFDL